MALCYHSLISHITSNKIINHTDTFLSHCWPFSLLDISDFLEDTTLVICINRQRHQFTPTLDKNEIPHTPRPASWLEKVYCEGRVSLCDARIVAVPRRMYELLNVPKFSQLTLTMKRNEIYKNSPFFGVYHPYCHYTCYLGETAERENDPNIIRLHQLASIVNRNQIWNFLITPLKIHATQKYIAFNLWRLLKGSKITLWWPWCFRQDRPHRRLEIVKVLKFF